MSAVAQISAPITFSSGTTAVSADVNTNFTSFRSAFNNLVTGANALAVDTIAENTSAAGVTVDGVVLKDSGITATGGGALTGTWTDLGSVTTIDINGGTIGGVTLDGTISGTPTWASTQAMNVSGVAATATALATARAINGVNFDGTAAITVTAAAGTLTGTTLKSTVITSSLTQVGVLSGTSRIPANLVTAATFAAGTFSFAGSTISDLGAVTTVDINGGTVGGVTLDGTISGTPTWASDQAITLSTAAQPNITSLGTLTSLAVSGTSAFTGNVGIGAAAGARALSVAEATTGVQVAQFLHTHSSNPVGIDIRYSAANPDGTGNLFITCASSAGNKMEVRSNGGIANFQSNDADLSDERMKEMYGVIDGERAFNAIMSLNIKAGRYLDNLGSREMVLITAQNAAECEDGWVAHNGWALEDGTLRDATNNKDIYLSHIRATQHLADIVETNEEKIERLEARVAALEA